MSGCSPTLGDQQEMLRYNRKLVELRVKELVNTIITARDANATYQYHILIAVLLILQLAHVQIGNIGRRKWVESLPLLRQLSLAFIVVGIEMRRL